MDGGPWGTFEDESGARYGTEEFSDSSQNSKLSTSFPGFSSASLRRESLGMRL